MRKDRAVGGIRPSSLNFFLELNFSLFYQMQIIFFFSLKEDKKQENIMDTYCPIYCYDMLNYVIITFPYYSYMMFI